MKSDMNLRFSKFVSCLLLEAGVASAYGSLHVVASVWFILTAKG